MSDIFSVQVPSGIVSPSVCLAAVQYIMSAKPLDGAPSENSKPSGAGSWVEGPFGYDTFLVHGAIAPDPATGAILTPIVQATTFVQVDVLSPCYVCAVASKVQACFDGAAQFCQVLGSTTYEATEDKQNV